MVKKKYPALLLFFFITFDCCSGKYNDIKSVLNEMIIAQEALISALHKAENTDETALALNNFAKKLTAIVPKMKAMQKKYPKIINQNKVPQSLLPLFKKNGNIGLKLSRAMSTAQQKYAAEPKFRKAQRKYLEAFK